MELNFSSVETIANLNASAAFFSPSLEQLKGQVDSGRVFKEDTDNVPTLPVRLAKIGSHRAIDAQFQGVPFETFIVCDDLYQGSLATKQDSLLDMQQSLAFVCVNDSS
ncbi:MAG: hypothetical protein J5565_04215 [Muribaculaceae bacterium]|nr:hypothetical protein [Muribaculaceae bacterium]